MNSEETPSQAARTALGDFYIEYDLLGPLIPIDSPNVQYRSSLHGTPVVLRLHRTNSDRTTNLNEAVNHFHMLQSLRHPKIIDFIGATMNANGDIFEIDEDVGGLTLYKVLHDASRALSWRDNLLQYAIDVCEAMSFIHANRLILSGLKTTTIFITENGTNAKISLGAFALEMIDEMIDEVHPNALPVTTIAPEVISGAFNRTEKSDVYSFGIVLWEMCTRQVPYAGEDRASLALRIVNDDHRPVFPEESMPDILEDLYEDCVASNLHARPSFSYILVKLRERVARRVNSDDGPYPVNHPANCVCAM